MFNALLESNVFIMIFFKSKSHFSLKKRIALSKKITKKHNFISIKFYEDKIKSNKTIDLVNYLKKKYNRSEIFF